MQMVVTFSKKPIHDFDLKKNTFDLLTAYNKQK